MDIQNLAELLTGYFEAADRKRGQPPPWYFALLVWTTRDNANPSHHFVTSHRPAVARDELLRHLEARDLLPEPTTPDDWPPEEEWEMLQQAALAPETAAALHFG